MNIQFISTKDQIVNVMTILLPVGPFQFIQNKLHVLSPEAYAWWGVLVNPIYMGSLLIVFSYCYAM